LPAQKLGSNKSKTQIRRELRSDVRFNILIEFN
jgi:hypothetical protein